MSAQGTTELDPAAFVDDEHMPWFCPWDVVEVKPQPNYEFFVRFADGTAGPVRMRERVWSEDGGVFKVLRDPNLFATVCVEEGVAVWPVGLDLAPDAMHEEIKAHGEWVLR